MGTMRLSLLGSMKAKIKKKPSPDPQLPDQPRPEAPYEVPDLQAQSGNLHIQDKTQF